MKKTPAALGYSMPAEWESHEATWIAWPHNRSDWPGKFATVPWVYSEIVRKLTPGETVRILVKDAEHEKRAERVLSRAGADRSQVEFYRIPTNRCWIRDYGPFFIKSQGRKPKLAASRFRFNAWARYSDWQLDDAVPDAIAEKLQIRLFPISFQDRNIVLEGGSIDVNGRGTLMATEECLLDRNTQVRNPGLSQKTMERILRSSLGVKNVLWLGRGIAGDDTHGHVDDVCRFVNPHTVVLCRESDPKDPNYTPLEENFERMQEMKLEDGASIDVVALPMPEPLYCNGQRLPASYANFYIGKSAVLVPTFNDPNDRKALGIMSELIPDRPVAGIHAVDLVWGLGTLHCLTREHPACG